LVTYIQERKIHTKKCRKVVHHSTTRKESLPYWSEGLLLGLARQTKTALEEIGLLPINALRW